MPQLLTAFFVGITLVAASAHNRDPLSPTKVYVYFLLLFGSDVFVETYPLPVVALFWAFLLSALVLAPYEGRLVRRAQFLRRRSVLVLNETRERFHDERPRLHGIIFALWLLTILPLVAQVWLIFHSGGLGGYIDNIGSRVVAYDGIAFVGVARKLIMPINVLYFAVLISRRAKKSAWTVFCVHAAITLLIGVGSASRGALLTPVVCGGLIYHWIRRPIPLRLVAIGILAVMSMAAVLGAVRQRVKVKDDRVMLREGHDYSTGFTAYALKPIEASLTREVPELQYGRTFASALTNFIPRRIWPEKPPSGGVIFSRDYFDNKWGGASNLSTGIVTESILNFGRVVGAPGGLILSVWILGVLIRCYAWVLARPTESMRAGIVQLPAVTFVSYLFITVGNMHVMEFANMVGGLTVKAILLLAASVLFKVISGRKDAHQTNVLVRLVRKHAAHTLG